MPKGEVIPFHPDYLPFFWLPTSTSVCCFCYSLLGVVGERQLLNEYNDASPYLIYVPEPRDVYREPHSAAVQRPEEGGFGRIRSRVEGGVEVNQAYFRFEENLRRVPARDGCATHLPLDRDPEAVGPLEHNQTVRNDSGG